MKPLSPYFQFAGKVFKHKCLVFRYGLRTKAPLWRLFIHDWTKLLPVEFPHYARQICGSGGDEVAFAQAWNHHSKHNPHHWEYWIPVTAHMRSALPPNPLPMPEWAVREMVADWLAASHATLGAAVHSVEAWSWFQNEKDVKLRLHPDTWATLNRVLVEYFESH